MLEDDQVFLHWQERVLEARGGSPRAIRSFHLPTSADRYVRALHDWVNRYGGEPFPGQSLPPRLSRAALMDRLEAHTLHCRSCGTALRRLQRGERIGELLVLAGVAAAAWLGGSHGGPAALAALLLTAAALGLRLQCGRWIQQLQKGSGQPPRNRATLKTGRGRGS